MTSAAKFLTLLALPCLAQAGSAPTLVPWPTTISLAPVMDPDPTVTFNKAVGDPDCGSVGPRLLTAMGIFADAAFPFRATTAAPTRVRTSHRVAAGPAATAIDSFTVCVPSPASLEGGFPTFAMDETYTLRTNGSTLQLHADTVWGAMRGLATAAQLVVPVATTGSDTWDYLLAGAPLVIEDAPRFPWRGLMIDTARHFLPVAAIQRTIDAAAAAKLNVLHWHIVDAESFPAVLPDLSATIVSALGKRGAYAAAATYSAEEMASIVDFAADRGVRIVVEWDNPGHAASWGAAYPAAVTSCPKLASNLNNLPLSPADNMTVPLLRAVLATSKSIFPDSFVHLGGDEVVEDCWAQDPAVLAWMKARGYTSTADVYQYFVNETGTEVTGKLASTPIFWQDVFDAGLALPPRAIVEVWRDVPTLQKVLAAGHPAILAASYYLNVQIPNANETEYKFFDTWKDFYFVPELGSSPGAENFLGSESCMWAEQCDEGVLDTMVWPRAAAMAERLWSPASVNDLADAEFRLNAHSCRLRRRGVRAAPLVPGYCAVP
jgi:hexosaminidase